ncbi:MAG: response regulator transcription factor [Chloroflexi bacterium]|nr:response regulator transcription factor [Chloroflexota bacterium]
MRSPFSSLPGERFAMVEEQRHVRIYTEPTPRSVARPPLLEPLEGGRVLCVAEDPQRAKRDLAPLAKNGGYEVDFRDASPGESLEALGKLYRMVVFDVSQPNGPGYRLCERWRTRLSVPVFVVLHGAARHDVLRAYQAGADAYILAPFDHRELLARVQALLRRQRVAQPIV